MKYSIVTLIAAAFLAANIAYAQSPQAAQYSLPAPAGPYKIGTVSFNTVDTLRFDSVANKRGRDVIFQVWYPAARAGKTPLPYVPANLFHAMLKDKYNDVDSSVLVQWTRVKTHTYFDVQPAKGKKFPLVFFLHGFGMSRYSYISIIEDLVSHGFVVVSVDSPYSGLTVLPDGKIYSMLADNKPVKKCEAMAADVSFILTWMQKTGNKQLAALRPAINFAKPGVMGHSLGGAAALEAGRTDKRFAACIDLDGDTWGKVDDLGVTTPSLILLNTPVVKDSYFSTDQQKQGWDKMKTERKKTWVDMLHKNPGTQAYAYTILGACHFTFTDFPFVTTDYYKRDHFATAQTIIAKQRGLTIISAYVRTVFKRYLLNDRSADIRKLPRVYTETSLYASPK